MKHYLLGMSNNIHDWSFCSHQTEMSYSRGDRVIVEASEHKRSWVVINEFESRSLALDAVVTAYYVNQAMYAANISE